MGKTKRTSQSLPPSVQEEAKLALIAAKQSLHDSAPHYGHHSCHNHSCHQTSPTAQQLSYKYHPVRDESNNGCSDDDDDQNNHHHYSFHAFFPPLHLCSSLSTCSPPRQHCEHTSLLPSRSTTSTTRVASRRIQHQHPHFPTDDGESADEADSIIIHDDGEAPSSWSLLGLTSRRIAPEKCLLSHPRLPQQTYNQTSAQWLSSSPSLLLLLLTTLVLLLLTNAPTSTLAAAASCDSKECRHKSIDENYQRLVPLTEIPQSCTSNGFAFVEGGLEKCDVYAKEGGEAMDDQEAEDYQKYKCRHLRVHAYMGEDDRCVCERNWKGPTCNEYIGCPDGYSLYNGVCTPNVCQHDGQLALGSKQIECICQAPWDGRFCERLACWRMASKEHERRWRNAGDHCECASGFEGDRCEKIVSCKNGELVSGQCVCKEGWKGEVCERKCIPNQTCAAASSLGVGVMTTLLLFLIISATTGLWLCSTSSS